MNFHLNKNTNKIYGKSTPILEVEVTRNTTFVYIICPWKICRKVNNTSTLNEFSMINIVIGWIKIMQCNDKKVMDTEKL